MHVMNANDEERHFCFHVGVGVVGMVPEATAVLCSINYLRAVKLLTLYQGSCCCGLWYCSKIGERLKRNHKCFHGFEIRYWTWHRPSGAWRLVRGISYNPQIVYRQLDFSRFVCVEEHNASEGRCHDRFNIGSQIMETYPIPFSSLSDVTIYEYQNLRATKLLPLHQGTRGQYYCW